MQRRSGETKQLSCVELYFHLILIYPEPIPLNQTDEILFFHTLYTLCEELHSPIQKINGVVDHLHILFKLSPALSLENFLHQIKSTASQWLRSRGHPRFAWQLGHALFSCSPHLVQSLSNYIAKQKEHHATLTFAHEIRSLTQRETFRWHS